MTEPTTFCDRLAAVGLALIVAMRNHRDRQGSLPDDVAKLLEHADAIAREADAYVREAQRASHRLTRSTKRPKPGTAPSSVNRPKPHDPMVKGNGFIERLGAGT